MDKCKHLLNQEGKERDLFACCSALEEFTDFSVAVAKSLQGFKKLTEQLHGRRIYWGNDLQSHCFWWLSPTKVSQPQSCAGMLKKCITLVFPGPLLSEGQMLGEVSPWSDKAGLFLHCYDAFRDLWSIWHSSGLEINTREKDGCGQLGLR